MFKPPREHSYRIGSPQQVVELEESLITKRNINVGAKVDKTTAILFPLIIRNMEPGSIIHTDGFLSYNINTLLPTILASCGGA
ncbi:hypothetical protein PoB_003948000 [Plakobranchus ocellatus]|uniref:ISXO2-like transposase domain-containing protein n=1 Tax=Plakobranchus ocellatus TaxID=259542 RepID=A0AAV4B1M5_9GAST|nr:hypothetical protein PoB_003948000 [Plakobranchus ocellatus]